MHTGRALHWAGWLNCLSWKPKYSPTRAPLVPSDLVKGRQDMRSKRGGQGVNTCDFPASSAGCVQKCKTRTAGHRYARHRHIMPPLTCRTAKHRAYQGRPNHHPVGGVDPAFVSQLITNPIFFVSDQSIAKLKDIDSSFGQKT